MTTIEVTAEALHLYRAARKQTPGRIATIPIPQGALLDPAALSQAFSEYLPKQKLSGKITFLLNLAQTVLRVRDSAEISKAYPLGNEFRKDEWIFSHMQIGEKYLHGAVPAAVSGALVEFVKLRRGRTAKITGIELLEHRLLKRLCFKTPKSSFVIAGLTRNPLSEHVQQAALEIPRQARNDVNGVLQPPYPLLVFIPQAPGVRLMILNGVEKSPQDIFFFSNNPKWRKLELKRILCGLNFFDFNRLQNVTGWFVFSSSQETAWLTEFLGNTKMLELQGLDRLYSYPTGYTL